MPEADWASWPLVEVRADGAPADESRRYLMDVLAKALARGEQFAVVVQVPDGPEEHGGGGGMAKTLRSHRPGLQERCRGIAFVVGPEQAERARKMSEVGPKIMGCPTTAVHDSGEARSWAVGRLSEAGLTVPAQGGTPC
ncbi:STAS/SEC14 domain-containing protein [Saccharothrix australiensis]|uniref:SpoIIAA-like protein n=1 Tax=Saccharothrix australiensis TaxID=2072 RepID=A0A495VZU2_9PSEU|nr:STAS/SEC14 domain-containing protein [Saccharothrix australiensis]RKT54277.1 hypothetical protein C8E97_2893 [Saccharothrix australiensis]